jgi:hypothetical protein
MFQMELCGLHLQERIAVMSDKKAKKKLCDATLRSVKKQLAKPRVSKSAKKSGTKAETTRPIRPCRPQDPVRPPPGFAIL